MNNNNKRPLPTQGGKAPKAPRTNEEGKAIIDPVEDRPGPELVVPWPFNYDTEGSWWYFPRSIYVEGESIALPFTEAYYHNLGFDRNAFESSLVETDFQWELDHLFGFSFPSSDEMDAYRHDSLLCFTVAFRKWYRQLRVTAIEIVEQKMIGSEKLHSLGQRIKNSEMALGDLMNFEFDLNRTRGASANAKAKLDSAIRSQKAKIERLTDRWNNIMDDVDDLNKSCERVIAKADSMLETLNVIDYWANRRLTTLKMILQ